MAADHLLQRGITGLSLSQLAKDIGSNNRMLLYYFGSKDKLFAAAVREAYARTPGLRDLMDALRRDDDLRETLCAGWRMLRAEENVRYMRLFFEAFGAAVRDPQAARPLLDDIARDWPRGLTAAFVAHGYSREDAAAAAVQLSALWRGLQFSLLEGVDVDILDAAHDRAIAALF